VVSVEHQEINRRATEAVLDILPGSRLVGIAAEEIKPLVSQREILQHLPGAFLAVPPAECAVPAFAWRR